MYYYILNEIIKKEIDLEQKIAIYPFGKNGMEAKRILNERFGKSGIIIDNVLAKYNPDIMDINTFRQIDSFDITIIICATNMKLNRELMEQMEDLKLSAKVVNILDPIFIECPERKNYFEQVRELCSVKKVPNHSMIRIGREHDGGYIMPDMFENCRVAYSFGIADDVSWDEDVARRKINVFCYDPSIESLPRTDMKLNFEKIGISGKDEADGKCLTLKTILERNGHENERNMILKMDVEGAEWGFLESTPSEILDQFAIMIFEFHGITEKNREEQILRLLSKIKKTHQAVWIHANNCSGGEAYKELKIPTLLEVTYVNVKSCKFEDIEYNVPTELDMPNISTKLEIEMRNWGSFYSDNNC